MQEIVINTCYGSYCLSKEAYLKLGLEWDNLGFAYIHDRTNPRLIELVKSLGPLANGDGANLKVVRVPDGVKWTLEEHAGKEWIAERHRTWR